MPIDSDLALKMTRLQSKLSTLQSDLDAARGAYQSVLERIQSDYGYTELEDAEEALTSRLQALQASASQLRSMISKIQV